MTGPSDNARTLARIVCGKRAPWCSCGKADYR